MKVSVESSKKLRDEGDGFQLAARITIWVNAETESEESVLLKRSKQIKQGDVAGILELMRDYAPLAKQSPPIK